MSVVDAINELDELVTRVRFAEALRRKWETCRAEAAVTSAAAGARLDGLRVETAQLRRQVAQGHSTPAAGWSYWRAHAWATQQWEPLNGRGRGSVGRRLPIPARAAQLHALLSAPTKPDCAVSLAGSGRQCGELSTSLEMVAVPSDPQAWKQFEQLLKFPAPAPIRCALALFSALRNPFFGQFGAEVARILVRDELTSSGFEPTGTWQWEVTWDESGWNPPLGVELNREALNDGLKQWLELLVDAYLPTRELLRRVQAGQWG